MGTIRAAASSVVRMIADSAQPMPRAASAAARPVPRAPARLSGRRPTLRDSSAAARGLLLVVLGIVSIDAAQAQFENNRRPPRPDVTLPDGPARQVILRNCTKCHGIDEYGYYALDRAHWDAVIERMKTAKSGLAEGTDISDADKEILLDWLVAEYGPDSEPLPRQYVIRPLEDFELLNDARASELLETGCSECHSVDTVLDATLTVEEWRLRLMLELSRGGGVLIADTEPLVQWLIDRGAR